MSRRMALGCVPLSLVLLAVCGPITPGIALGQSATGSIEGVVVDQSGGRLSGVTVTLTQPSTGLRRIVTSDERGFFRAFLLPVGPYELDAGLAGFEMRPTDTIRLTVGQTLTLRVEMAPHGIDRAGSVRGAAPVLETSRSQVSSTVGEVAVQSLPVNGRNVIDLALLTPGVTRDVRAGDLSVAGQRGTLNSLIVDAADDNNSFFGQTAGRSGSGLAPYQFSQEVVKELRVNANSLAAEYGRAGGAVITVVTRSGTNALSGSAFEFFRDRALNANNAINELNDQPKPPYHYHQFGGTLGGPIRRDRHFFFFNYDGQRNTTPNPVLLNVPPGTPGDAATLSAISKLEPLATSWKRKLDQDVFLIKTDHELSAGRRLTLRYNQQDFTGQGYENGGSQNSIEHTGASLVRTETISVGWTSVHRRTLFNDLRFQYARDREPGEANSENPEATIFEGSTTVLTIGRNSFSPRESTVRRWQVADTLSWARGAHMVRGGLDLQFDDIYSVVPAFFGGSYTFRSLASFDGGRPTGPGESYQQNFSGTGTSGPESRPNIREYSVFWQDEWKTNNFTVNAGLRYDLMKTARPPVRNPDPQLAAADIDTSRLKVDTNNWGPRLGVTWSPGRRRHVVRGGWGLSYGRTPSVMLGTAHTNNGLSVISMAFTGSAVPSYPASFAAMPGDGTASRPSIVYIDRGFQNARLMQASAGYEWEVLPETTLALTYLFVDGNDLPRSIDRNLGTLGSRAFTVAGTGETASYHFFGTDRPFTSFARVIALESSAESRYNGLTLELNRRLASGFQIRAAYTIGKVEDTVPDATAVVPGDADDDAKYASNPADFGVDRTDGNPDQRQRLALSGVYTTDGLGDRLEGFIRALVKGWNVSAILTAQSGRPYSARVGASDLNGDGNSRNDLAPGTARNQFRLPSIVTVDARIARNISFSRTRLQLILETFNLFDRDNITGVQTDAYGVSGTTLTPNAAFQRPTSSAGERILQLGARLLF